MQFRGAVLSQESFPYSIVVGGAALIQITVSIGDREGAVRFLIDTGADVTTLNPRDASRILMEDLLEIDFAADSRRVRGRGIGGGVDQVVRDAALTLRSIDREQYEVELPILIAQPTPAEPGEHGNWRLPSLLGRDFLRHFRLELHCGEPRSVLLETL